MKLLISAGGTGGHVFPGLAVAEALSSRQGKHEAVFVGTREGLEAKAIPKAGYRLLFIDTKQFMGRSLLHKLATLVYLVSAILKAMAVIGKERPDAILGMGGFTSVPMLLAGAVKRVPSFVHEQNRSPGLANRLLSRFATAVFVSFDETAGLLKARKAFHTGNPLRKRLSQKSEVRSQKSEEPEGAFGIFVFGGSRGARRINEAVVDLLPYLRDFPRVTIYHQTGTEDFGRVEEAYRESPVRHEVFPFTEEMEKYYGLADVVISRAGATTIFELASFRKPAVLIPYPYSAGNHQWENAAYVEKIGGAHLVSNDEATGEKLFEVLKHLMGEPELLKEMGENIGRIYVNDAAGKIIEHIEGELRN